MIKKTNAVRITESFNVPYELKSYEVDEDDLSGITVAEKTGMDPDSVFKTLVASGEANSIHVFGIPVTMELNLKKAAAASGNKKIELVAVKDLLPLTGYLRGGCSPIGMKKKYPFYLDQTAEVFETISISAGTRGLQMILLPGDLLKVTEGILCELI